MASAAAVAADASRSPLPYLEQDDVLNTTGTITSADAVLPDEVPANDEDDDDEDITRPIRRKPGTAMSTGARIDTDDDDLLDGDNDADEELFGSEPDEALPSHKGRQLDDEDLDSGDDEGRNDRLPEDEDDLAADEAEEPSVEQESFTFMDVAFGRHPIPEPSDGELYLMRVPRFLSIAPQAFDPEKFQPPTTDHHSKIAPSGTFSAHNTAMTTIRWRPSPSDPSQLQSNARIIRWSDGSLTTQLANDPLTQYGMHPFALAPPQVNAKKPTPLSKQHDNRKGKPKDSSNQIDKDNFTYLAAPNEIAQFLRITNKFTTSLRVDPASNANSDALERLHAQMAAASGTTMGDVDTSGMGVVHITEDPELAKKKAEQAEKEKVRAQKRREAQEQKDRERGIGRTGINRRGVGHGTGLTVGGLEDDEEMGRPGVGTAGRSSGGKQRKKPRPNRKGEIYSDEDDYDGRRRTKEDEYEEDGFLARSDEEEEVSDESEGDIDEGIDLDATRRSQQRPGREREVEEDAEGDADEDDAPSPVNTTIAQSGASAVDRGGAGSPTGRNTKRRRVVEEDDDED